MKCFNQLLAVIFVAVGVLAFADAPDAQATANPDGSVSISEENFPDDQFREYVLTKIDGNKNGVLSQAEISNTKKISCQTNDAAVDYKGIEFFTELEELEILKYEAQSEYDCDRSVNVTLNVSQNSKLKKLVCDAWELKQLDLSGLTHLEEVELNFDSCPDQDLSNLGKLKCLTMKGNVIMPGDTERNVILGNKPLLQKLYLAGFTKAEVDFQKMPALQEVKLSSLSLSEINLSGNKKLKNFECYAVQYDSSIQMQNCSELECVNVTGYRGTMGITLMDLQNCPQLSNVVVRDIKYLTTLKVVNCPKLESAYINVTDSGLLHIEGGANIKKLSVSGKLFTELDVKDLVRLNTLEFSGDVRKLLLCNKPRITKLILSRGVKTFDFTPYRLLEELSVNEAKIQEIDVRKNHKLKKINCWRVNKLGKIRFSPKARYRRIVIGYAKIRKMDIRSIKVQQFQCRNSKLKQLLIKGNSTIQKLDCRNNQLTTLNLQGCKRLKRILYVGNRKLKKRNILTSIDY